MKDSLLTGEMVSDLMDGRLGGRAFADAVGKVAGSAQALEMWHNYHAVGDVLHSSDLAPHAEDAGFLNRFQQRLQQEVATRPVPVDTVPTASQGCVAAPSSKAANDAHIPWKWVAGFASVIVVGAASWSVVGEIQGLSSQRQLAQADGAGSSTVLVDTSNDGQVMIRDPRLDRLLMAHRQSGGASALQVPSGFLRDATFEVSSHQGTQN